MNYVFLFSFLLFYLINFKLEAQTISGSKDIGYLSGQKIGNTAHILRHIQKIKYPLRIGLMKWYTNYPSEELTTLERLWISQLTSQKHSQFIFQPINTELTVFPPARTHWIQLCHQHQSDIFVQLNFQKLKNGYWINIQLIYGINGKIIKNKQLLKDLIDINTLNREILSILDTETFQLLEHTLDIGIESDPGEVHIETNPENMYVELNGYRLGKSPMVLRHLPVGQHQLTFKEIQPFLYQRLRVTSTPPGVEVYLNQQFQGITPLSLPTTLLQTTGDYLLEFKGLSAYKIDLEIVTQPEGVAFSLDDNTLHKSPVTFQQLSGQKYRLRVKENEISNVTQFIQITPNFSNPLIVHIEPYKFAKLFLEASEENTTVILDQENKGEMPLSINIPQGVHHLKIIKQRFKQVSKILDLKPGETYYHFFKLEPKSIDTSIFLNPTGEIDNHISISTKFLGFSNFRSLKDGISQTTSLSSIEVDYGWPQLTKIDNFFDLGLSISGYTAIFQKGNQLINYQGFGGKLQLFRESQVIPVSVALGSYINLDINNFIPVGFISFSRNFFDFSLHFGIQTHGMNLNIGYTGFDNLRLGFIVFANSFFGLFTKEGEEISTLYGLQIGYKF